jgi:two-component system CheB/CheR fusion protein
LAEAIRRRDQFLAMLSHELRNPLAAILNAANIMDHSGVGDEFLREVGNMLQRQSQQMARLLDDLLDVSRVTQNKIEMRKQPTPVSDIVEGAVESVRPLIAAHDLKFCESIETPSMHVDGDPVRLQQALSNLLVNAAKYTPSGGRVGLDVFPEDGHVVLRVSDTGAGISPENLDSIFELFVQCDQTLSRSRGGMGVGLTLVRSIVEQHAGRVTAHSDGPGQGSRFEIRLPRLKETAERLAGYQEERRCNSPAKNASILIVEDQDDNRLLLRRLLELQGFQVYTAENGPKGLAAIEQHRPDVALIDIGLPGLTGYEVARQVRDSLGNQQIYLVALTGYGQSQDVQAAFDAGFDNHVVKPLDSQKLARLLELRHAGRERQSLASTNGRS